MHGVKCAALAVGLAAAASPPAQSGWPAAGRPPRQLVKANGWIEGRTVGAIILGTLVGALIVGVFRNGLTLMGVSSVYQILVTGVLVILAVLTDQMSRKGAR